MNAIRRAALAATVLLLSACGGGGDGGNSGFVPPADAFDVQAAWKNLLTTTRTWSGIIGRGNDNHVYEVAVQIAPAAAAPFPLTAAPANRSVQTVSTRVDGGPAGVAVNELFVDAGFLWQGSRHTIDAGTPSCDEASAGRSVLPPTAVRFDATARPVSGALLAGTIYATCADRTAVRGTATATWSLEFESGTVYFCLNTTSQDLAVPPNVTSESDCLQVSPDGSLGAKARITLRASGFELVARN